MTCYTIMHLQVVYANSTGPHQIMMSFESFLDLASLNAYAFAKEFLAMDKPLEDYRTTLDKYAQRAADAEAASMNDIDCGLVRVRVESFKQSLIDKAKLVNKLLIEQVDICIPTAKKTSFSRS
jgi:hypothetical protein